MFDTLNLMTWLALILVSVSWLFLFRRPGACACGPSASTRGPRTPSASRSSAVRYAAVMTSGALAGLGGAYLSFGFLDAFSET